MAEPLDSIASWPCHLQESWRACAERGEVDAQSPPASIVDAYLQVAEAQRRRWAGIPWGDGTYDLANEGSLLPGHTPAQAKCATCGASKLEHFYTPKRRGKILCPVCYQQRVKGAGSRNDREQWATGCGGAPFGIATGIFCRLRSRCETS